MIERQEQKDIDSKHKPLKTKIYDYRKKKNDSFLRRHCYRWQAKKVVM